MKSRILESHYSLAVWKNMWMNRIDRGMNLGKNDDSSIARSYAVWILRGMTFCSTEKFLKCSRVAVWGEVLGLGVFETEVPRHSDLESALCSEAVVVLNGRAVVGDQGASQVWIGADRHYQAEVERPAIMVVVVDDDMDGNRVVLVYPTAGQ
jgi:hypothetical protein